MTDHPRQQLQHILHSYGPSICDAPKRCEALLRDLCPDNRREVHLLAMALKEGVAKELMDSGQASVSMERTMLRLSQRLQDHLGTAEHLAMWSVETWAQALGIPVMARKSPTVQCSVTPAASLWQAKSSTVLLAEKQFAGWQKIGESGEVLAAGAPQWAAVRDENRGLMWAVNPKKAADFPNPANAIDWHSAQERVEGVNRMLWCGYNDWRMPTVDELKTLLITEQLKGLFIRRDVFPDISSNIYRVWTSSPSAIDGSSAWLVYFSSGYASISYKNSGNYVRLVRSS